MSNECWAEENHIHYHVYTFISWKYLEMLIIFAPILF